MKRIYLALGSNLGDREAHIRRAIALLDAPDLRVLAVSPVYETAPVGFAAQGWFLNLVLAGETSLLPLQLLARCARAERVLKRQRTVSNGPRTIDIDILFYGQAVVRTAQLEIPHPRYDERRFVLQPLADLDPGLRDPMTQRGVLEMLAETRDQSVRKTDIVISV